MGHNKKFSPEQEADIARLYVVEGLTQREIAEQFGEHRTVVRSSLLRSGVTMRPKNSPRPEYEWVICACGKRAAYKTGQCVRCYNQDRNQRPDIKERRLNWWLMANGLTRDAYDAMLTNQGGVCAVCQKPDPRGVRLAVDHDHACCPGEKSCGKCVRGLLCVRCNRAIGLIGDSAKNAERLFAYLSAHHPVAALIR